MTSDSISTCVVVVPLDQLAVDPHTRDAMWCPGSAQTDHAEISAHYADSVGLHGYARAMCRAAHPSVGSPATPAKKTVLPPA